MSIDKITLLGSLVLIILSFVGCDKDSSKIGLDTEFDANAIGVLGSEKDQAGGGVDNTIEEPNLPEIPVNPLETQEEKPIILMSYDMGIHVKNSRIMKYVIK